MASLSICPPLTRDSVIQARQLIRSHIHLTPVLTNKTLSRMASTPRDPAAIGSGRTPARPILRLWFKCENMQRTGAFKARGAFHAIKRLQQEPGWLESGGKEKGVVGYSAGEESPTSPWFSTLLLSCFFLLIDWIHTSLQVTTPKLSP